MRLKKFSNNRFEENLDKIGVRFFDIHETYDYALHKDYQTEPKGRWYIELLCEKLNLS